MIIYSDLYLEPFIQIPKEINDQIKFLSHTVMPWYDSVSVLNEYGKKYDIKSEKWNLVTGDKEEIYRVARDGYFADNSFKIQESINEFIHTENFYLIDTSF